MRYLALLLLAVTTSTLAAEPARIALVIGNGAYEHAPVLRNPVQDARDIAAALGGLGYSVELVTDAKRPGMEAALAKFAAAAVGADQALVYYSGHGVEVGGVNYLLPVEARIASETTVPLEAVSLPTVMGIAARARRLGLVVLDACRDNPLANDMERAGGTRGITRGLASVEPVGGNLLVAYATKDGRVAADGTGHNSPYTTAILEALKVPGLEVRLFWGRVHDRVLAATRRAQEPFTYGALGAEALYLSPPVPTASRNPSLPPPPMYDSRAAELVMWQSAQGLGTVEAYREYLGKYPDGQFSGLAKLAIAKLGPPTLGGGSSSASMTASVPVQDCDRLAQPPNIGPRFPAVTGVDFGKIDGKAAQQACERARRQFPGEARFTAYLGRAFDRLNRFDRAAALYREAAEQGNPVGQSDLGLSYELGHGVPQSDTEALKWYHLATDQGSALGQSSLGSMYERGRGVPQSDTEALKWYRLAAGQGFADGQSYLGSMYERGRGVSQDYTEALKWYLLAAGQGDAGGQVAVGSMYEQGHGVPRNYTLALKWYRLAADQGDARGQSALGLMYDGGRGVTQSDTEALKWYRLAADQGDAVGQSNLGNMYERGRGVPQSDTEALKWYRLAAGQGDSGGQVAVGSMYEQGRGVPQDYTEALKWYRLAADQGDARGQAALGYMYDGGRGVAQSDTEALKWYRLAAGQGDTGGQIAIGSMYEQGHGVPQNYTEALRWYRLAADQGDARGQTALGFMYDGGRGVVQSDLEALKWYRLAADQGYSGGQVDVGTMYERGHGVPQSDTEALKWYRLAADQGDSVGQFNLGTMYERGRGVPQSVTAALKWYRLSAKQGYQVAQQRLQALDQAGH